MKKKDKAIVIDSEPTPLWLRQIWDTDSSWEAFHHCYLGQPNRPRGTREAYRRWCDRRGIPIRYDKHKRMMLAQSFTYWAKGADSSGEKPVGTIFEKAASWKERAAAWDIEQERLDREMWAERQKTIRQAEWERGNKLLETADTLLEQPLPDDWTLSDLVKVIDTAFKLHRRAAGMVESTVNVTWRKELTEQGIDPEEVIKKLEDAIYTQLANAGTAPRGDSDTGSDPAR